VKSVLAAIVLQRQDFIALNFLATWRDQHVSLDKLSVIPRHCDNEPFPPTVYTITGTADPFTVAHYPPDRGDAHLMSKAYKMDR
jgi:hypothetical protein